MREKEMIGSIALAAALALGIWLLVITTTVRLSGFIGGVLGSHGNRLASGFVLIVGGRDCSRVVCDG